MYETHWNITSQTHSYDISFRHVILATRQPFSVEKVYTLALNENIIYCSCFNLKLIHWRYRFITNNAMSMHVRYVSYIISSQFNCCCHYFWERTPLLYTLECLRYPNLYLRKKHVVLICKILSINLNIATGIFDGINYNYIKEPSRRWFRKAGWGDSSGNLNIFMRMFIDPRVPYTSYQSIWLTCTCHTFGAVGVSLPGWQGCIPSLYLYTVYESIAAGILFLCVLQCSISLVNTNFKEAWPKYIWFEFQYCLEI